MRLIVLSVIVAGCGRVGFDPRAIPADAAPDAAPLGCAGSRGPIVDLVDPRLAGFWSFNEGTLPAADHSASGIAATATGSASVSPGGVRNSLGTSGGGVTISGPAGTYDYRTGLTVEAWVNISEPCTVATSFITQEVDTRYWTLGCHGGGLALFQLGDGNGPTEDVASARAVNDSAWHHLAGVVRGNQLEIWIDGALAATNTIALATPLGDGGLIEIGPATGNVDEVRLWRAPLAPDELARIAAAYRPGLLAYWSFDGTFTGFAGLGFDGTAIGAVSLATTGRAGGTARFAGTDGRVDAMLPDLASSYTAMGWFRTPGTGAPQSILDREPEGDPRSPVHVWINETQVTTNIRSSTNSNFGGSVSIGLTDDCWHHLAAVRDGADGEAGAVRLYIDGALGFETTGTFGITTDTSDPFRIGYRLIRDPRPFLGSIDEVQVYNRVLTAAEIAGIYDGLR